MDYLLKYISNRLLKRPADLKYRVTKAMSVHCTVNVQIGVSQSRVFEATDLGNADHSL